MAKNILITGGCGFIGSNLVRHVLTQYQDWRVTNLDALTYCGNPENLADIVDTFADRYDFVHGDVCDAKIVTPLVGQAQIIVHLAAESHVDRSIAQAQPFVQTNVLGTHVLLEAIRQSSHRPHLILISTDEVYGSLSLDDPQRFTEHSPLNPRSPYAASKAAADMLAMSYHHTFGLPVTIVRGANNFGPYQYPEKVIPLFITRLLQDQPVPIYGDGMHVRDWIFVEDFCQAVCHLIRKPQSGEVFNIGANNEQSNLVLARTLLETLGKPGSLIAHVADRPGHDRRYALDYSKFANAFGWCPQGSQWPGALEATVRWYASHESWWRPLLRG